MRHPDGARPDADDVPLLARAHDCAPDRVRRSACSGASSASRSPTRSRRRWSSRSRPCSRRAALGVSPMVFFRAVARRLPGRARHVRRRARRSRWRSTTPSRCCGSPRRIATGAVVYGALCLWRVPELTDELRGLAAAPSRAHGRRRRAARRSRHDPAAGHGAWRCSAPRCILVAAPAAGAATRRGGARRRGRRARASTAPCASWRYAYGQSAGGDVIEVRRGRPRARRWSRVGTKAVTFRRPAGRRRCAQLDQLRRRNVTYDGIDVDAGFTTPNGAAFENHSSAGGVNVTFRNGRDRQRHRREGRAARRRRDERSTVIDNVEFHDVVQRPTACTTSASSRRRRA